MTEGSTPGRFPGSPLLAAWAHSVVIAAGILAGLHFGRGFLIPLVVAMLLVVLLGRLIDRMEGVQVAGRSVPRWLARLVAILVAAAAILVVISILTSQARGVAAAVPRYEARFDWVLQQFVEIVGEEHAARGLEAARDIDLTGLALGILNSASGFLGQVFMILMFAAFLMAERSPIRKKLDLVAPSGDVEARVHITARLIIENLQNYVSIKTFVSLVTSLICYVIMRLVGLDFAETWAVLTFALNFIPTIGSIAAVIFPAIVALVQFDSIGPFLVIVLGCGVVQFVVGNVIEPALTGKKLNLSPMMVILALTVWSALWGIPGAFLSVPITVCLMIVFSHMPGLRWIAVLMSGDGQLPKLPETTAGTATDVDA